MQNPDRELNLHRHQNSPLGFQRDNYHPQKDEEHDQLPPEQLPEQPQRSQNSSPTSILMACIFMVDLEKAVRLTFRLITFLVFIDLGPVFIFTYYMQHAKVQVTEIQTSFARPLEFISTNLKADPIMDLQIIDAKSSCPAGFEPLKLATWPGTVAGCLCNNGDLLDSSCETANSKTNTSGKCEKDIPSLPPVEIYEANGSVWCGKRAVLGTGYVKKTECPSGFQECYPGGCFVGDCPVTQVKITPDRSYILTRDQGELPLINIQISPNDIPCFRQDLFAKSPDSKVSSYKLLAIQEKGCGKYGLDSLFSTKLASMSTFDAYTQNSLRYSVMNLPGFQDYAKSTPSVTSATVRMKTARHDYCQDIDEQSIQNHLKAFLNSFPPFQVTIIVLIGHLMYFVMICVQRLTTTKEEFLENFVKDMKGLMLFILYWVLPLVIQFFVFFNDHREFRAMKQYFREFQVLECFGEGQGSIVIRDYLNSMWIGEVCEWLYLWLLVSGGLALLVCVWYATVKKFALST